MSASDVSQDRLIDLTIPSTSRTTSKRRARWRSNPWLLSVRPHQWSKSALVLLAPLAGLRLHWETAGQLLLAVVLTCVAASGAYLLNDVLDAPADRLHPTKRFRPVASGRLPRAEAAVVGVTMLTLAPVLGRFISNPTGLCLAGYGALTVAYSLRLKHVAIVDIVTIAAGFVARVLIGAAATGTPPSVWFIVAVATAALMVATGKRRGEVHDLGTAAVACRETLHRYHDEVTSRLLLGSSIVLLLCVLGWATIGGAGHHLDEDWAVLIVAPVAVGVGRYLRIAVRGDAARPERLVRDRVLQLAALAAGITFVIGAVCS